MNQALKLTGIWLVFAFFQIMLFDSMTIGQLARPYGFLLFLLMIPVNMSKPIQYLIAFGTGLFIDIFTQSIGLHTFSCVLMMALRPYWINIITGTVNRAKEELALPVQNLSWIASYILPLIFIHHFSFFLLEAYGFAWEHFSRVILMILTSSLYSFVICFLIFGIFYKRSSSR
jgi:hypothetical protein